MSSARMRCVSDIARVALSEVDNMLNSRSSGIGPVLPIAFQIASASVPVVVFLS